MAHRLPDGAGRERACVRYVPRGTLFNYIYILTLVILFGRVNHTLKGGGQPSRNLNGRGRGYEKDWKKID
ncbi:hypothetical protein DSCO28_73030 (plasmid) [Desulfosarcina ovata subsp. sediminis]|uniref:Uncharacterized protein n=1 Tax=Desulfosarcina ovata subsp. sediminis TaxID=885957 RepID=A0A5K8A2L4_9BACT|nr:hypothetical protein DSCO28_73030 [Desulfosarcina ovata subsp. sediminis]